MHRILSAAVLAVLLAACELGPFETVRGSGTIVSEQRDVPAFTQVGIAGALHAVVVVSDETSVKLTGDDNLLEYIQTAVVNGVLTVGPKGGVALSCSKPIEVHVSTPALAALAASGASRIDAQVRATERFDIGASGASRVEVSGLQSDEVVASASGASEFDFHGSAERLELGLSGASKGLLDGLSSSSAKVALSGASEAKIVASSSVTGNLSGASKIEVRGGPAQRSLAVSDGCAVEYQ